MATVKKSDTAPGAAFGKALKKSELEKRMMASIPSQYQKFSPPPKQTIGPKYQAPKSSPVQNPTLNSSKFPSRTQPVDSDGRLKTKEPIFSGPLGKAIAGFDVTKIKGAATRANAAKRQQAQPTAKARPSTIAPLKSINIVSDYRKPAPKAAPVAKGSQEYNPDTATRYQPPKKVVSRPAATRPMEPVKPMPSMSSMSVSAVETQPMAKREADLSISTKKGNLFQRLGERIKQRQLARAARKAAGSPMKSTTSIPSTPTPSAPQAESGQGLSTVGKAMLDNYLSRKKYMGGGKMEYMGGGKMKKYAKGGMIEKEGMKPKSKMDKKKAFLEMIAKLKAKKK